jgi:hypothetical protein
LIKTLFFEYFLWDELQTGCESNSWSSTQLFNFEGRVRMTFMVSDRVKNGVCEGQIFKLQKPCRVVSQMKALHECFPDQKKNVDAMTSFDNVMT